MSQRCALAAVVALVLVACGSNGSTANLGSPTKVVIAASDSISALDPQGPDGLSFWSQLVNWGNVTEGLTRLDGLTPTVRPNLALSWQQVDPTTLQLKLVQGVTFSDGEPFNSAAVVANIERVINPKTAAGVQGWVSTIKSASVVDDSTVDIITSAPTPGLDRNLSGIMMIAPSQVKSTALITGPLIGTGPYMIASMSSQEIVLKANTSYRGAQPKPAEVDLMGVPEVASRIAAVQSGQAQIAFDIPSDQVTAVPRIYYEPQLEMVNWRLNANSGVTQDIRVRQALVIGTDLNQIRTALVGNKYSQPCDGNWVPAGIFGWDPNLKPPTYDPAMAKSLLQQAGAVGKTVTLVSTEAYPAANEAAQALTQQIQDLGLKVNLQIKDTQGWLNAIYSGPTNTVEITLHGAGAEQWDALPIYLGGPVTGSGISEFPHAQFPQFDQDVLAAQTELNDSKRQALLFDAAVQMQNSYNFICGWTSGSVWGAQKNIGWSLRRDNRIDFNTIHFAA